MLQCGTEQLALMFIPLTYFLGTLRFMRSKQATFSPLFDSSLSPARSCNVWNTDVPLGIDIDIHCSRRKEKSYRED